MSADVYSSSSTAPVSSLQLSTQCLTHGEMRVSCSSEGDGPQYRWTLDEHPLRDTEASSGDETNTITLKKGLSGDLTVPSKTKSTVSLAYPCNYTSNRTKISEWVIAVGNTL
ncbi:unnamed protein product [Coregonus sp. 'balchen']|nr:unnamed protein product [Coregonus sp. 'balchen']